MQRAIEKAESEAAGGFFRRTPPPLLSATTPTEVIEELSTIVEAGVKKFPSLDSLARSTMQLAQTMLTADAQTLTESYQNLLTLYGLQPDTPTTADLFTLRVEQESIVLTAKKSAGRVDGVSDEVLERSQFDLGFLAVVANVIAESREHSRALTIDEHSAVLAAYDLLQKGGRLPGGFRSIGIYGMREHQTNLSIANPGDGHLQVTSQSSRLLDGSFVHIEHIDRDGVKDRELLEPYRLPATVNAAKVRLHIGAAAPCTAYIGRPVFESKDFKRDLLKSVHMTASACTSMFMNGVADCKIGIERMTATQAITFMKAVAGNVVREPMRQYLSAAFNINLPFEDDRDPAGTRLVTNRVAIARLGIELAVAGRFNKIAWDGSSNKEPSDPFVNQLTHAELLDLVHSAHEQGLETYISAGMKAEHMAACVNVGVDGVGIGTSLHDFNPETGLRGQLKAQEIEKVLTQRDRAATEPLGRGAKRLAALDRMFKEQVLYPPYITYRIDLYEALRKQDASAVAELLDALDIPSTLRPGSDHPVIEQAKRVLATEGVQTIGRRDNEQRWEIMVNSVKDLLPRRDIAGLVQVLP